MQFTVYTVRNPKVSPLVKYILFNHSLDSKGRTSVISYANNNICLGIVQGKKLNRKETGEITGTESSGISSYLSGMYLTPHCFLNQGVLDEICIDFSPLGFYQFSRMPVETYIFDGDPLREILGAQATHFFERIFEIADIQERGILIEELLLKKMDTYADPFLEEALTCIHQRNGQISLVALTRQLNCSENKLLRAFKRHFDITPKEYIRIVRFRHSLHYLKTDTKEALTDIAYRSGYYDQSHFIREYHFFTHSSPKCMRENLISIEQEVMISVNS